jgi:hypothetical protein
MHPVEIQIAPLWQLSSALTQSLDLCRQLASDNRQLRAAFEDVDAELQGMKQT